MEVKAQIEMVDPIIGARANVACTWVGYAKTHMRRHAGKPRRCLLVPHDGIRENTSLAGLANGYSQPEIIAPEAKREESQEAPTAMAASD